VFQRLAVKNGPTISSSRGDEELGDSATTIVRDAGKVGGAATSAEER